jgi:hypothetical protein
MEDINIWDITTGAANSLTEGKVGGHEQVGWKN